MKNAFQRLLAFGLAVLTASFPVFPVTIHTIGDSTMANYDESSTDKRGWTQMFQQFFDENAVTINNRGKSGASSKTFYRDAGYWNTVVDGIQTGDYVFIQFAHNDEKNDGLDGDSLQAIAEANGETISAANYRGTTASGTFKTYIRAFIDETKAKGGIPVVVTPVCRKYFNTAETDILRNGQHDLGNSFNVPESNDYYDYAQSLRDVAAEYGDVQVIDLTKLTRELYLQYGKTYCTDNFFCDGDNTHFQATGATEVAKLCAQAMKEQGILADYINLSTNISVSPTSGDMGKAYVGQKLTKEFTVNASSLSTATGNFTIYVSNGFEVSADGEVYSSSLSFPFSSSACTQTFYVRTSLISAGETAGTLTLTDGTLSKTIQLVADGVAVPEGQETYVLWRLDANDEPEVKGHCGAVKESWTNMEVASYQAVNRASVWPAASGYDSSHVTQRNVVSGGTWPSDEIDEVSTRYIQFGITATDAEIAIDSIGLYVAGAGGNGMRCKVYYDTDTTFSSATLIKEFQSMTSNNIYQVSALPVLKLEQGQSLYLRFYPWYSMEATGKTLCLSSVMLHGIGIGVAEVEDDETGISKLGAEDSMPDAACIFDLSGRKISNIEKNKVYISAGHKFMVR